jgi:hypothetical protein
MLAAQAGNRPLVEALLGKGADPLKRDEYGHTAWEHALERSMREARFARDALPALVDLLAPASLDVQTGGRLVRLERHQGEYWILSLMLAGLKTQWSRFYARRVDDHLHEFGFFAAQFHEVLEQLPDWLWSNKRRKRSYVNQVLARAEVDSSYTPARRLWTRTRNGQYLPSPAMLLPTGDQWETVMTRYAIDWVDRGCGDPQFALVSPAGLFEDAVRKMAAASGRE